MQSLDELTDNALLDRLQRGAFAYISENTNPANGLVADTSRAGSPCSIAVIGGHGRAANRRTPLIDDIRRHAIDNGPWRH
jgi:hypothetical protein